MIKKIKEIISNEKLQDILELFEKLLFLLYAVFGFNSVIYGHKIVTFIMLPSFLLGALVLFLRALKYKNYCKMPGFIFCILFMVSHGISTVFNIKYNLKENIILMIYLALYFLLFYVYPLKKDVKKAKKEFDAIAFFTVIYGFLSSVAGLIMLSIGYKKVQHVGADNYEVVTGFTGGRLWGIFLEPNRASIILIVAIVFCLYFVFTSKKKLTKALFSLGIVPMFLHIVFSDSRAAIVSIAAAALFGCASFFLLKPQTDKKKIFSNVLISALLIALISLSPVLTKNTYNACASFIKEYQEQQKEEDPDSDSKFKIPTVERNYDLTEDVSNGRFEIWKSGFEVFSSAPVFGTSYNAIRAYAKDNLPNTYIVKNNTKIIFGQFHNEVLNVLACQGIAGLLIFVCLVAVILYTVFKNFTKLTGQKRIIASLFLSSVGAMTAAAMFNSAMLYSFCASTPLFWMCLGYLVFLLKKEEITLEKTDLNE